MREKWSSECWEVRFITDTVSLLLLSSWRPLSGLLNTKGDVITCCCVAREAERPFISCELENVPRRWRQMKIHRKDFYYFLKPKEERANKFVDLPIRNGVVNNSVEIYSANQRDTRCKWRSSWEAKNWKRSRNWNVDSIVYIGDSRSCSSHRQLKEIRVVHRQVTRLLFSIDLHGPSASQVDLSVTPDRRPADVDRNSRTISWFA